MDFIPLFGVNKGPKDSDAADFSQRTLNRKGDNAENANVFHGDLWFTPKALKTGPVQNAYGVI